MAKPFASSADLAPKREALEILGRGVYALTAEGDPNVGAIEAEDFVVAIEARATPAAARDWLAQLRQHTDKPVRHLVLTHYHAVRALGASAFGSSEIIAHDMTRRLIDERGKEDWASEFGRMPRLFKEPEGIPGLTHPTLTFSQSMTIPLGGARGDLELHYCGRGHTAGDIVAWLPKERLLFAGDLVESEAALYTGDAFHMDWSTATLDRVAFFGAETIVGGRGRVTKTQAESQGAIEQTRHFLNEMRRCVKDAHDRGGALKDAFAAAHKSLAPRYGRWPIFEHCMPFNVQRLWDEYDGIDWPRVWTAERDRAVWAALQG